MDSENESMHEDWSRNKIPPSFLSNFPFGEKEGIVYLILLESHFPKACRDPRVALFYEKRKKKKEKEFEEWLLKTC